MSEILSTESMVRQVPFSLEAEQSVLGAILIDPERINDVSGIIRSDDFYLEQHMRIYEAMQGLMLHSKTIDVITLLNALTEQGTYTESSSSSSPVRSL